MLNKLKGKAAEGQNTNSGEPRERLHPIPLDYRQPRRLPNAPVNAGYFYGVQMPEPGCQELTTETEGSKLQGGQLDPRHLRAVEDGEGCKAKMAADNLNPLKPRAAAHVQSPDTRAFIEEHREGLVHNVDSVETDDLKGAETAKFYILFAEGAPAEAESNEGSELAIEGELGGIGVSGGAGGCEVEEEVDDGAFGGVGDPIGDVGDVDGARAEGDAERVDFAGGRVELDLVVDVADEEVGGDGGGDEFEVSGLRPAAPPEVEPAGGEGGGADGGGKGEEGEDVEAERFG